MIEPKHAFACSFHEAIGGPYLREGRGVWCDREDAALMGWDSKRGLWRPMADVDEACKVCPFQGGWQMKETLVVWCTHGARN